MNKLFQHVHKMSVRFNHFTGSHIQIFRSVTFGSAMTYNFFLRKFEQMKKIGDQILKSRPLGVAEGGGH